MTNSSANSREERLLLEEYRVNIELWKHDDTLRQQRDTKFLYVNAFFVTVLGLYITILKDFPSPHVNIWVFPLMLGLVGVLTCATWSFVLTRNTEFIRFRRYQLRAIESRLGDTMTTFTRMHIGLNEHEPVNFPELEGQKDPKFVINEDARRFFFFPFIPFLSSTSSSTEVENIMPSLLVWGWLIEILATFIMLIRG